MSIPQPPEEEALKNIIEKLAQFVARNGTDFEDMTKNKQKDNPKFQFLFGGEFYDYYQYQLASAKASMEPQQQLDIPPWQQQNQFQQNQQIPPWQQQQQFHQAPSYNQHYVDSYQPQQQQHSHPQPLMANPQNPTGFVKEQSDLEEEEKHVKEQIAESEKNLNQQYAALMTKQEEQIETEIMEKEEADRLKKASFCGLELGSLDKVLMPIMDSCTKDLIGNGKTWILANSSKEENCVLISEQLLNQVMKAARNVNKKGGDHKKLFTVHLHSLYLINDVLHHAQRKNLDQLVIAIGNVIVPLFCLAKSVAETDQEQEKLLKLLGLWTKFQYFEYETYQKFDNHTTSLKEFNQDKLSKHTEIVNRISMETQKNYRDFEKQHQEYTDHIANLMKEKKRDLTMRSNAHRIKQETNNNNSLWNSQEEQPKETRRPSRFDKGPRENQIENRPFINQHPQPSYPPQPNFPHQGGPPRMPGPPQTIKPDRPYFDLPAGLMAPLVRLDEMDYKELDPNMIRLPMNMPPNDRLRAAVDAFYAPPSHDRPRNGDGWEANGLFEFFKAKMQAKKDLETNNSRMPLQSKPQRRNMRSRFSSTSPHSTGRRSRSSSSHSRSRSRSRSYSRSRSTSRSRSRSRSSSKSRSYSRSPRRNMGENNLGIDRTSPDRHVNLNKNAATPPRLMGNSSQSSLDAATAFQQKLVQMAQQSDSSEAPGNFGGQNRRLGSNNVGAMMMAKMGWGGAGLGAKEQGRQDIIKAGEVRDNYDKFKGLGNEVNNPYDEFRKNRSKGYINRIRSRRHSPRRK